MYEYIIKEVVSIYDGDTITAVVDIGFNVTIKEKFRLARINAPELKGNDKEKGIKSRDALVKYLNTSEVISIKTIKDRKEKFGRYLCEIWIGGININDLMVKEGFASTYLG